MSGDKALLLVLDLRKKEEDSALEMWTDAKNAVINFERQIEQLKQFEKIYENEMTVKSKNGMDMNMYMSYHLCILYSRFLFPGWYIDAEIV